MPIYRLPMKSIVKSFKLSETGLANHIITVKPEGGSLTAGSLTIEARLPGAAKFDSIGTVDFSAPISPFPFSTAVAEYKFTLTGEVGDADSILITDTLGIKNLGG